MKTLRALRSQGQHNNQGRHISYYPMIALLYCFFYLLLMSLPAAVFAAEKNSPLIEFTIPPSTLDIALNRLALQANIPIIYDYEKIKSTYGHAVLGLYNIQHALTTLLKDTPYTAIKNNTGIFTLETRTIHASPTAPEISQNIQVEETLVTGYRSSLRRSLAIKRHYNGIVDVIQSQDIGKFPDANVAEALQRITGVAIERNGGEGQFLTVRGFGPEFNTTLINGRTVATDNQERGFSFDILPAKLISQAHIQKTTSAKEQDGSIGANIQLVTPKPFDFIHDEKPSHLVVSGQVTRNSVAEKNTTETFALASHNWQKKDLNIGILAAIVDSNRSNLTQGYSTEGFRNTDIRQLNSAQNNVEIINDVYIPRSFRLYQTEAERDQTSIIFAAQTQWFNTKGNTLEASFDILSTRFDERATVSGFQAYFEDTFLDITLDENNTAIAFERAGKDTLVQLTDNIRQQLGGSPQGNDSILVDKSRPVTSNMLGVNFLWDNQNRTTPFSLELDYAFSRTENLTGGRPFSSQGFSANQDVTWSLGTDKRAPSYSFGDSQVTDHPLAAHFLGRFGGNTSDEIHELELSTEWTLDTGPIKTLRAGLLQHDRTKQYVSWETTYPRNCAYCGRHNEFSAETLAAINLTFPEVFQLTEITNDFAGGLSTQAPNAWYHYDFETLTTILESEAFINAGPIEPSIIKERLGITHDFSGIGFNAVELERASYRIKEAVTTAFAQIDLEGYLGNSSWAGNIGARYSFTETMAQGTVAQVDSIVRANDDDQLNITYLADQPYTQKNHYHYILPSVNFSISPTPSTQFRFSSSKTITRPNLNDLGQETKLHPRAGSAILYKGNPNLLPFESINTDLASEWYFNDESFIGANLFYKSISQFVSAGSQEHRIDGVIFTKIQPTNQETATAKGLELALQHTFNSGWGLQTNFTYTASSAQFFIDTTQEGTQTFAIEGLSPRSYNFIGFYENTYFSARASYNWRQEYLRAVVGAQSQPESVESYGQLDVNFSFNIAPNISIFAQGTNVLKEETRLFSVYKNRVIKNEYTGARYILGINAKF